VPVVTLLLGILWIIACTALFFWVLGCRSERLPSLSLGVLIGTAFVLRIVPAAALQQGPAYEMHLFQEIARDLLAGENVLSRLPYFPFLVYWIAASEWLGHTIGMDFTFWIKLPSIVADVLMLVLLQSHFRNLKTSATVASKALLLYALNPVTILVSGYHGQFDLIPTVFLVLSIVLLTQRSRTRSVVLASLSLGLAILTKTWPGLMVLCVMVGKQLRNREKLTFAAGAAAIPFLGLLVSVLAFGGGVPEFVTLVRQALQAGAIPGWWGYTGLVNGIRWLIGLPVGQFGLLMRYKLLIVFVPVLSVVGLTRKMELRFSVFWSLLTLFIVAPGFGLQSLSWLVPFFVVELSWSEIGWYVGLSVFHMIVSYWGIHFSPGLYSVLPSDIIYGLVQLSAVPVWVFLVVYAMKRWLVSDRKSDESSNI
jgi:hypothetical protein